MTLVRSLDWQRASAALERVEARLPLGKEYRVRATELPSRLHANGLTQTLAYLLSQRDGPDHALAEDLAHWLTCAACPLHGVIAFDEGPGPRQVLKALVEKADRRALILAASEARAFASRLKQFASTLIPRSAGEASPSPAPTEPSNAA